MPSIYKSCRFAALLLIFAGPLSGDESQWLLTESSVMRGEAVTSAAEPPVLNDAAQSLRKVGGGLAVVLGGFFLLTVLWRKQGNAVPGNELMESLGSVQIAPKVRLNLVRLGKRILVLHISGQNVQRVAELEDPEEVHEFLAGRSTESFPMPPSVGQMLEEIDSGSRLRGTLR